MNSFWDTCNIYNEHSSPFALIQVMRNKDDSITLKLGDFGLAVEVKAPIYTICGTPTYVAPEILSEIGIYGCSQYFLVFLCNGSSI